MAIITLPTIRSRAVGFKLVRGDKRLPTMTGGGSIIAPPFHYWMWTIDLARERLETNAPLWFSAELQMSKLSNTCKIVPPGYFGPRSGYSGSTPQVDGAGQLGLTIDLKNMTPNTLIAKEGDYIGIGDELKGLTADLNSDVSGLGTAQFEPALRSSPPDSDPVEFDAPTVTMGFVNPEAAWDLDVRKRYDFKLYLIEDY